MDFKHERLAGYTFLGKLGAGSFGSVYKITDALKAREYALKILHEHRREYLEYFKKEAEVLKKLRHSNIVQFYDCSFDEKQGEPFILMEYMKHGSMRDYLLQNKEIDYLDRLILIRDVIAGLQHAHQKNIIHRDVKPENIFITENENRKYACLGDFGIAKLIESETETEGGKGTRMYLPPEVMIGEKKHSKESDMYGLGISMYELLAGRHPFESFSSYLKRIKEEEELNKPSLYNSSLDQTVDKICLKAITIKEKDRYQSLNELFEDVDSYIKTTQKKNPEKSINVTDKREEIKNIGNLSYVNKSEKNKEGSGYIKREMFVDGVLWAILIGSLSYFAYRYIMN